jgi:quinol monooxygenase YgiN
MEQFTLMIKFTATKENHLKFKEELLKFFALIEGEENFVSSILHQNLQKEEEYMVYEVWNDNIEHFMTVQMKKPFVLEWEQLLVDMGIKREPAVYSSIGKFGASIK